MVGSCHALPASLLALCGAVCYGKGF